jgi:hypothetical protein
VIILRCYAALILCLLLGLPLAAQELEEPPDNEIDRLFEEAYTEGEENESGEEPLDAEDGSVIDELNKRGFTFDVDYSFIAGFSPGWAETPWYWKKHQFDTVDGAGKPRTGDPETQIFAAEMKSTFSLDFRISPTLRVHQTFQLDFPDYKLDVREFFADYNLIEAAFFRVGKHTVNWGVSRNFPYTNLPIMIPPEQNRLDKLSDSGDPIWIDSIDHSKGAIKQDPGDPYAMKADIPIGIGGVQFLMMSRPGFIRDQDNPELKEFGYGFKYNLAFDRADIDIGTLYHSKMPYRSFLSVKSTLPFGTEIYSEGLLAVFPDNWAKQNIPENWTEKNWSFNIGLFDEFFGRVLTINLEYFFDGERQSQWLKPENSFQQQEVFPFIYGHNGAVNLGYRPALGPVRFFAQCLYNFNEKTAQLVPAVQFNPVSNLKIYLGVPMALGRRDGTYYTRNADKNNRPFSIVMAVSFEGGYRFSHYE